MTREAKNAVNIKVSNYACSIFIIPVFLFCILTGMHSISLICVCSIFQYTKGMNTSSSADLRVLSDCRASRIFFKTYLKELRFHESHERDKLMIFLLVIKIHDEN